MLPLPVSWALLAQHHVVTAKTGLVTKHKTSFLPYKVARLINMKIFSNKKLFTLNKSFYFPLKFRKKWLDGKCAILMPTRPDLHWMQNVEMCLELTVTPSKLYKNTPTGDLTCF